MKVRGIYEDGWDNFESKVWGKKHNPRERHGRGEEIEWARGKWN